MSTAPRIWFDVEDLFHFADRNARPTGIQRVCYEIFLAALADPAVAPRIGFVRHSGTERGFIEADWELLDYKLRHVTDRPSEMPQLRSETGDEAVPAMLEAPGQDAGAAPHDQAGPRRRPLPLRLLRRAGAMVPRRIARPGFLFAVMQVQAGAALTGAVGLTIADRARRGARQGAIRLRRLPIVARLVAERAPEDPPPPPPPLPPRRLAEIADRGDVLAVLGSPWFEVDYAELVSHVRGRLGLRVAVLMHDVIPVRRPEWVDRGTVRVFRDWYRTVLPLADYVFANSQATADDVERWCARDAIRLPGPVAPVPIGTGFGQKQRVATELPDRLPAVLLKVLDGRPYVLFVSTIEARKNHMLLFRVWRRLLSEMGPQNVPDLVFAGKVGWMVGDLMSQIENSRNLDGRLHVIEGLDDRALRAVYGGCLFTVFPSFYEGWGLPVSESMAMGRPCVCSNATALPEAGGSLARYFDPFDVEDATRVIRATIEDRPGLAAWQDEVVRTFRPVGWDRAARAMVAAFDRPD